MAKSKKSKQPGSKPKGVWQLHVVEDRNQEDVWIVVEESRSKALRALVLSPKSVVVESVIQGVSHAILDPLRGRPGQPATLKVPSPLLAEVLSEQDNMRIEVMDLKRTYRDYAKLFDAQLEKVKTRLRRLADLLDRHVGGFLQDDEEQTARVLSEAFFSRSPCSILVGSVEEWLAAVMVVAAGPEHPLSRADSPQRRALCDTLGIKSSALIKRTIWLVAMVESEFVEEETEVMASE